MSDLLEIISTFPKVTTLTILEKQLANRRQVPPRTFVTQEEVHLQVEFPPYVPVLKTSAYNSTGVLNSYKVAARANRFPKASGLVDPVNDLDGPRSRTGNRKDVLARDRVIRKFLQDKIGTACGRCFRASCVGSKGSDQTLPCATVRSPNYVPPAWTHVLKSVLMWIMVDRSTYGQLVESFHSRNGVDFGSLDAMVKQHIGSMQSKEESSSYGFFYRDMGRQNNHFSFPVAAHQRCLASLPDLGNPSMLAGLCWWKEYGSPLRKAGMLSKIREARCDDKMSFGDGPSQAPLFILLQVPLWYRCADGSTLLVFANIRIVSNTAGLLDGKHYMAAIKLICAIHPQLFLAADTLWHTLMKVIIIFSSFQAPDLSKKANGA
jgi:hypothetical protein